VKRNRLVRNKTKSGKRIISAGILLLFFAPVIVLFENAGNPPNSQQTNTIIFIPYDDYQIPVMATVECTGFQGTIDQIIQACWDATPPNGIADASGILGTQNLASTIHLDQHPGTLLLGPTTYDFSALVGFIPPRSPCAFSVENDGITIQGSGWGVTNITTKTLGTSRAICTFSGIPNQNVTITGITFLGPGSVPSSSGAPGPEGFSEAVVVAQGNNWVIQNNEFTQWPWQSLQFAEGEWLGKPSQTSIFTHNSTIKGNYFHDNGGEGMCLCSGRAQGDPNLNVYNTITNNIFYHNGLSGFDLSTTGYNTVSNNILYNNGWTNRLGDECGAQVHGVSNTIINNLFIQGWQAGIMMNGSDNIFERNMIAGTKGVVALPSPSPSPDAWECKSTSTCIAGDGIDLGAWYPDSSANNSFRNNIIVGGGYQGNGNFAYGVQLYGGGAWGFNGTPDNGGTGGTARVGDTLQINCGVETSVTAVNGSKVTAVQVWGIAPPTTAGCVLGHDQAAKDLGPGNATGVTLDLTSIGEMDFGNSVTDNVIMENHEWGVDDLPTTNTNSILSNTVLLNGPGQINNRSLNSTVSGNIVAMSTLESGNYSVTLAGPSMMPMLSGVSLEYAQVVSMKNGANENVGCTPNAAYSFCVANGATQAYSIGGFTAPSASQALVLGDLTGFDITINVNDSGSTASNRILANGSLTHLTYPGFTTLTFIYDTTKLRWILTGTSAQPL